MFYALEINENQIKNNLSMKESDSLNLLVNDKNIVIKPTDKCWEILVWTQTIMKRLALLS